MDSTAGIRRASGRWLATAFWPGNTSRDLRFLLASLPAQLAAPAVIALPWLAVWAGRLPGKLTPLLGTAVVVVLLLAAIPALSTAERHLLRAFLGVGIPAPAARRTTWRACWPGCARRRRGGSWPTTCSWPRRLPSVAC